MYFYHLINPDIEKIPIFNMLFFIEKYQKILVYKSYTDAILMDLFKAFDSINYELLIAKL